jgi:hypothetical protein
VSRKLKIGRGAAMVELNDELSAKLDRVLREAAPRTMDAIERTTEKLATDAQNNWPEKTGRSKAGFEYGVRLPSLNRVEGYIRNNVDYAYYIKGKAQGGRNTWQELAVKPVKKALPDLIEDIRDEITGLLKRR